MGQFTGFTCDSCGAIVKTAERTRKITRYEGPTLSGEVHEDLCAACTVAPSDAILRPLRKRQKRVQQADASPADTVGSSSPTT